MKVKNPYVVTALIFAVILFVGRKIFHWGEISNGFVLLFFFLVTIGIRLDDIVKRISATNERLDSLLKIHSRCASLSTPRKEPVDVQSIPHIQTGSEEEDGSSM